MRGTPIWFGPGERPLFGWLHVPPGGRAQAGAVICPPLAGERDETYATLRRLAEDLSDHQICALRFDYDGTGDSAGDERGPGQVERWLNSVSEAIAHLRLAGVEEVVVIGVRFGALLAGLAAARDGRLHGLVLWDPVVSGRSYLSEQRLLAARVFNARPRREGRVDIPGMMIAADTAADIRSLQLGGDGSRLARRVLVLQRSDRPLEKLRARLRDPGVSWSELEGQQELMEKGFSAGLIAHSTNRAIRDWLRDTCPENLVTVHAPSPSPGAVIARTATGGGLTETAISFGPTGLSAIVTESSTAASSTTAIFLSGTGPCRMWVDWARRWAASGLRCVRLDLSGMGDSPVRSPDQRWGVLRAPEHFDDVSDACAHFSADDSGDLILVGHCAAGYQALESGLRERPRAVVALNPVNHFWFPEADRDLAPDPRRRIALPLKSPTREDRIRVEFSAGRRPHPSDPAGASEGPGIRRLLRGGRLSRLRRLRQLYQLSLRVRTGAQLRALVIRAPQAKPANWLREYVDDGVELLLLCCKADSQALLVGTSERILRKLATTGHIHSHVVPDLEHSTFEASRQLLLGDIAADYVSARVGAGSMGPPAAMGGSTDGASSADLVSTALRSDS